MSCSLDKKHLRVNVCKSKFFADTETNVFALVEKIFEKGLLNKWTY